MRPSRSAASPRSPRRFESVALIVAIAVVSVLLPRGSVVSAAGPTSTYYEALRAPVTSAEHAFIAYPPPEGTDDVIIAINLTSTSFRMAGPDGARLDVGTYVDARLNATPGHPMFSTNNCNSASSTFTVHEIAFGSDGAVTKLAFDFDCPGTAAGSMRFESTWPAQAITSSANGVAAPDFGDTLTTETSTRSLTLTSTGTIPTTIAAVDVTGTGAEAWSTQDDGCVGTALAPGESCTVDLIFAPTVGGDHKADLFMQWLPGAAPIRAAYLAGHGIAQTTTTVRVSPDHVNAGLSTSVEMSVDPAPYNATYVMYVDDVRAGVYYASLLYPASGGVSAAVGRHTVRVEFAGTPDFAPSTGTAEFFVVEPTTSTLTLSRDTAYVGQSVTMTANVTGPAAMAEGTLRIVDWTEDPPTVLGSTQVTATHRSLTMTTSSLGAGGHNIVAEYMGTDHYGWSGQSHGLQILGDTGVAVVKATVSPTTFYPYKDSYLDVATISGVTGEVASVSISVYNSGGTRVYAKSLGYKDGAYTTTWSGRNSAGTILASGKYRVVQTFKDKTGHSKAVTAYVNLSAKRLYTYTTYVNKTLAQAAKRTTSTVGWEFILPSASVYKSIVFQVYGRSSLIPGISMGGVDFRVCTRSTTWSTSCVSSWAGMGGTTGWYSKTLSTAYNRSGRYVRGMVTAAGSGVVYKSRIKVVYGILK
jgi:hypothetical protein